MADLSNTSGGIKKLNNHNYGNRKTCMHSYLQGHDLWEVIAGAEIVPPKDSGDSSSTIGKGVVRYLSRNFDY
jgi:hypothetical protein